jgi:hypothetical protein
MAQAHGLRTFYGDLVIHKMPDADGVDLEAEYFASELKRARGIPSVLKEGSFTFTLDDGLRVNLSNWFRTQYDLGIHFPPGQERALPVDAPLGAIRVECSIPPTVESFQPAVYRDQVAKLLGGILPPLDTKHWWHVVFTAASAFVFAHDIAKPILATVADLETYVKVGTADLNSERTWEWFQVPISLTLAIQTTQTMQRGSIGRMARDSASMQNSGLVLLKRTNWVFGRGSLWQTQRDTSSESRLESAHGARMSFGD